MKALLSKGQVSKASLQPSLPPGLWMVSCVKDVETSREDDPKVQLWVELALPFSPDNVPVNSQKSWTVMGLR